MIKPAPKLIIKAISDKDYPKTNSNFGHIYEDILRLRTIQNIRYTKAVYDPGLFEYGRNIKAIKAFLIKDEGNIKEDFKIAFENNEFYIFPFFENFYEFFVENEKYCLKIDDKGDIVRRICFSDLKN